MLIFRGQSLQNIFTKHLIELLLIPSGDGEQKPGPVKEKSYFNGM